MVFSNLEKQRFFSKTKRTKNGCLEWTGYVDVFGYGRVWVHGKAKKAHRVVWEMLKGVIPTGSGFHGTCVCHSCDNRKCVELSHLFVASQKENMKDAKLKGRKWYGEHSGSKNGRAKLTEEKVSSVKKLFASKKVYNIPKLAAHFGVSRSQLYLIKRGKSWAHVK